MAEFSTLVMRFRDLVTKEGGTISKHQDIIKKDGCVWWAWWKKGNEKTPMDAFSIMAEQVRRKSIIIFLIDSGQSYVYKATCEEIEWDSDKKIASPEQDKTPEYYCDQQYHAWFKFTKISKCKENEITCYSYVTVNDLFINKETDYGKFNNKKIYSLKELIQQNRTIWFVRKSKKEDANNEIILLNADFIQPSNFSKKYYLTSGNELLWLSDLHLIGNHFPIKRIGTKQTLAQHLKCCLDKPNDIGAMLISGDITSCAKKEGFDNAQTLIQEINYERVVPLNSENIVICPGNHDFTRQNTPLGDNQTPEFIFNKKENTNYFSLFYSSIYHLDPNKYYASGRKLLLPSGQVLEIAALNSLLLQQYTNFEGHGYLSQEQLDYVAREMGWDAQKNSRALRIVMMHHHYMPTCFNEIIDVTKSSSVVYDADRLMHWLIKYNVRLLLHGHKHKSFISEIAYPIDTSKKSIDSNDMKRIAVVGMGSTGATEIDNKFATIAFEDQEICIKFYRIHHDEIEKGSILQTVKIQI